MAVYTYTGRLADFGGKPFPSALPVLWVEPEQAGFSEDGALARKRIPVTVASNGTFSVDLAASSSVMPEAIYILRCEWFDGDTSIGWSEWARFRAPVGGGDIGADNSSPIPSWAILYGMKPPPDYLNNGLYIQIDGAEALLYGPANGRF